MLTSMHRSWSNLSWGIIHMDGKKLDGQQEKTDTMNL